MFTLLYVLFYYILFSLFYLQLGAHCAAYGSKSSETCTFQSNLIFASIRGEALLICRGCLHMKIYKEKPTKVAQYH